MNKQNAEGGVLTFWAAQYSKRYLACLPFVPASERDVVSETNTPTKFPSYSYRWKCIKHYDTTNFYIQK